VLNKWLQWSEKVEYQALKSNIKFFNLHRSITLPMATDDGRFNDIDQVVVVPLLEAQHVVKYQLSSAIALVETLKLLEEPHTDIVSVCVAGNDRAQ
jgi:hypothetical protein